MKHLSETELVELIEGELTPERARHAEGCARCGEKAAALRAVRDEAREGEWPEPSPLFWDHFAARVSDTIAQEPAPAVAPGWAASLRHPAVTWAAAASLAVLLMVGALWRATVVAPGRPAAPPVASTSQPLDADPLEDLDDLEKDAAWVKVRSVAGDFAWEDAQSIGIAARPGSAERAVMELSNEERAELARLLANELKRSGA